MKFKLLSTISFLILLSTIHSHVDNLFDGGIINNSTNNYSTLIYEVNDVLESSINPNEYKVGSGDQFLFSMIYPSGTMNMKLTVSPLGEILIPLIGLINIDNIILTDAFELIKLKCLEKYENAEVYLTLSNIRRFKVNVLGALTNPGFTSVTAISRVSDVVGNILITEKQQGSNIFEKSKIKSLVHNNSLSTQRNIVLIRNEDKIRIDLVKFKITGDSLLNPMLQNGDVIIVGYVKHQVEIYGAVHKQQKIEYVIDENLKDLIYLSGGFTEHADSNNIVVTRLIDDNQLENFIVNSDEVKQFKLMPNDHVYVRYLKDSKREDAIQIFGEINYPGFHPIDFRNSTVKDMIEIAGGYTYLADRDQIIINNQEIDLLEDSESSRITKIAPENLSNIDKSYLKARSAISKGKISSGNKNFTKEIMTFNLSPGDQIFIPKKINYIEIIGAILHPGRYPLKENFTGLDYIKLAGSKTKNATGKIYIIKHSTGQRIKITNSMTIENGDIVFVPEKNDIDSFVLAKDVINIIYQVVISILTIYTLTQVGS